MSQDAHGPVLWQALCWVQICTRLAKPDGSSESNAGQVSPAAVSWSRHGSGTGTEEPHF